MRGVGELDKPRILATDTGHGYWRRFVFYLTVGLKE